MPKIELNLNFSFSEADLAIPASTFSPLFFQQYSEYYQMKESLPYSLLQEAPALYLATLEEQINGLLNLLQLPKPNARQPSLWTKIVCVSDTQMEQEINPHLNTYKFHLASLDMSDLAKQVTFLATLITEMTGSYKKIQRFLQFSLLQKPDLMPKATPLLLSPPVKSSQASRAPIAKSIQASPLDAKKSNIDPDKPLCSMCHENNCVLDKKKNKINPEFTIYQPFCSSACDKQFHRESNLCLANKLEDPCKKPRNETKGCYCSQDC